MSEEDLSIDLTAKKKKKTKKPYDFGDNEAGGEEKVESEPKKTEIDDLDDELGDIAALKKKKKKKKTFNLDELGGALPDADGKEKESPSDDTKDDGKDAALDDLDFDFSSKKKKKKKKTTFDLPEADELAGADKENELDGVDVNFEANEAGAGGGQDNVVFGSQQKWLESDRDYTYDEMLEIIYNKIKEKNPESESGVKKKLVMRPPQVLRVGTKKTSFANFIDICKSLHRQPKHMQAFLLTELGTSGSVDANNQLIIKGRFQQKQIESVLRKYIKEYVACQTCRSPDTILQKETRLFFLQCETCNSRRSVANIKSGFQAVTGRRAAIRARTN